MFRIVTRDAKDDWIRAAVMSSLRPESDLFATLNKSEELKIPIPKFLSQPSTGDRAKVIARYADITKTKGDSKRGQAHFQSNCAICHRYQGEGKQLGPDLELVRGKPSDWLLGAILDPAAVIEARYAAHTVTTKKGESLTGIIASETANNLTFRLPGGIDHPILRSEIRSFTKTGTSLMPVGFEAALDLQAMADLLAWLNSDSAK